MITVLHITDNDKHFSGAIQEYQKRLGKQIEIITIKPVKHGSQQTIIDQETAKVNEKLGRYHNAYTILLSIEGQQITTEQFAEIIHIHTNVVFIIGGPYGLDESQLQVDKRISFGHMTMPHGLVKLVILEQIYRAWTLKVGKKYHY